MKRKFKFKFKNEIVLIVITTKNHACLVIVYGPVDIKYTKLIIVIFFYSDVNCLAQGSKHQGEFSGGGAQCTFTSLVFLCEMSESLTDFCGKRLDEIVQKGTDLCLSTTPYQSTPSIYRMIELTNEIELN